MDGKGGIMYHILYLKNCVPTIISFTQCSSMQAWAFHFLLEHQDDPDNRIEAMFEGRLNYCDYDQE